jgi:hypothetical protein
MKDREAPSIFKIDLIFQKISRIKTSMSRIVLNEAAIPRVSEDSLFGRWSCSARPYLYFRERA